MWIHSSLWMWHPFLPSYSFLCCLLQHSHHFRLSLAQSLASKYNFDGIKMQENSPENVTEWAANPGSPALVSSGVQVPCVYCHGSPEVAQAQLSWMSQLVPGARGRVGHTGALTAQPPQQILYQVYFAGVWCVLKVLHSCDCYSWCKWGLSLYTCG